MQLRSAPTSSLDTRRLMAFGNLDSDLAGYTDASGSLSKEEMDWLMAVDPATLYSEGGSGSYGGDSFVGDTSSGSGFNWGSLFGSVVTAGVGIGTAYAKQELLGSSTYIKDKAGNMIVDAQGHPVLANSSEGIRLATAAKSVGLTSGGSWVMPAAIGVGIVALFLLMKKGRR